MSTAQPERIRRAHAWDALTAAPLETWWEVFLALSCNLGGGLLPLLVGIVIVAFHPGEFSLVAFARNGEFALYTASLCFPLLYIVVTERKPLPFPSRTFFFIALLAPAVLAVVLYTLVAPVVTGVVPPASNGMIGSDGLQGPPYAILTIVLFGLSVILAALVGVIDLTRAAPPVKEMTEARQAKLEERFDHLRGAK